MTVVRKSIEMLALLGCLIGLVASSATAASAEIKTQSQRAAAEQAQNPNRKSSLVNSLGMTFRYIPPGSFQMGSPGNEPGRDRDERRHAVTLTQGYFLQTTEVTQKQWQKIMGTNPSVFKTCGKDCPVENVSWDQVQKFIRDLNKKDSTHRYRLPSEAEWEFACRAGSQAAIYAGQFTILGERNAPGLSPIAWYGGNSCVNYPQARGCSGWRQRQTHCRTCGPHPVGLKKPNAWGLYDMLGNVYEWCQDYFGEYTAGAGTDPQGPANGTRRIVRGGGWDSHARHCRCANRSHFFPDRQKDYVGFRLVALPLK